MDRRLTRSTSAREIRCPRPAVTRGRRAPHTSSSQPIGVVRDMPFSSTRARAYGVLTDCPTEPSQAYTSWGVAPGKRGIARGTSRSPEPGSGTKSLRVPTHFRLSDENSRGKVQNVCGDSWAQMRQVLPEMCSDDVRVTRLSPDDINGQHQLQIF